MTDTSIAQQVNRSAAEKNIPVSVQIELTQRCNLACFYCYQQRRRILTELPLAFWQRTLSQLAEAGTLYLTFTGGEPFIRPDILDIIDHARLAGFAVSLISNGTLITDDTARRLAELGVMDVGISLLAATAARHGELTGSAEAFGRALDAIRMLKRAGVKVLIKHTVSTENFGEYRALRLLADSEGCLFEADSLVVPQEPGKPSPWALSTEQQRIFLADLGVKPAPPDCRLVEDQLHCDAGRSLCGITALGEVVPCIQLPLPLGNLQQDSFSGIWSGLSVNEFRNAEKRISSDCLNCADAGTCSRCHGVAYFETSQWHGPAPSLCNRARAFK